MNFKLLKSSKNLQNSIWNIIEVLLSPLILFISIPIFLEQLGAQEYGIWMFVNTVIVVMQAFNLGLNYSTYKHVSTSISNKAQQQIYDTLNTNLSLTVVIFFVGLFFCSLLSLSIYYLDWFVDPNTTKKRLILCLLIGAVILFTKLAEQILYNVYRAYENFKYVTVISVAIKIITVLGNIALAIFFQNIIYILCFTAITASLGLLINYRILHQFIPNYRYQFILSKSLVKHEINYSLYIWLQSIAIILTYQGDRLLVSYGFSLSVLSYYAIVSTIYNHIHMAFAAITAWIFPQIAKNQNNKQLIFDIYINSRNITAVLSIVLLCLFCLLSKPLFTIWLGTEHYMQIKDYLRWFSIFEFFFIFTIIPNYFLNASGNEKFSLKMVLSFTGLNMMGILLGFFFYQTTIAMLVGLVVTTIVGMYWYHLNIVIQFDSSKQQRQLKLLLLFTPSLLGSGTAFFDVLYLQLLAFALCLISLYFVFIRNPLTNFKLLLQ
ncbi:oligosaccharide flippase family protein [Aureispira anguillae]|uniref:Oligosaccharide flippase family protein n=1 Tax=Aureispira anguillae TaxID=2864201 RepID=A0A915VKG4_9BACT|nr:oligosaccharide flippase family protein [Aureispira anguillae]BDS09656.1 oligosaccharide flippase family protein [Aureispira anguillae]